MPLRLTQSAEARDRYRVEASLEEGGRRVAGPTTSHFQFALTDQDREDLRWYLEDYLQQPFAPEQLIAGRIEARMAEIGEQLFRAVFESSETARRMWARLQGDLNAARIEVVSDIREATAIPWELLRDPLTRTPLALEAAAFVRSQADVTRPTRSLDRSPLEAGESKIRILLVICRPRGGADVPFRSVASRIVRSLTGDAREIVQLDVLRPPTFEQLAKTLRAAKRAGQPYHVLHFDGHGTYMDLPEPDKLAAFLKSLGMLTLGTPRPGKHGYLLFENPQAERNAELVDGPSLGKLMVETGVPVPVLNACQSAFAEAPAAPVPEGASTQDQVAAFGSLAQEVMNAGVTGIVAMRYVLYVETAKRFVTDLYDALIQGETLGAAVTFGRKQLADSPLREIGYQPIALQDWPVPIVYEADPIVLFPPVETLHARSLRAPERISLEGVPPPPDAGFFGRDETLLALDRAFDTQSVVLLHAYAGSGKTTTAAEFARWYAGTGGLQGSTLSHRDAAQSGAAGGVEGRVLFTSFERYLPLPRVLDAVGRRFEPLLERNNIHWLALTDEQRRRLALDIFRQVPVLWIWNNVEPVAGFGGPSAWSAAEQAELADFLRAARDTRAKFLLTSRRDERDWLVDLPRRVTLPPMPMQERVQLARGLAERHGRTLADVEDWRPLLRFTEGNPMTITVVVGQALCDGLRTRDEIEAFVARLRAGEPAFDDEASQGRSKSLGASLAYGFDASFTAAERRQLALLHLFQGFVDVGVLRMMGGPEFDWCLPEVRGLTRDAGIALLDRAAGIGLLTAHGGGTYSIHPALPWYFRSMFEQYYPPADGNGPSSMVDRRLAATRAFVEAMGVLGNYYHDQYQDGNRDVIAALEAEEANLLHARQLALRHARGAAQDDARRSDWWDALISTMQGLRSLYAHTGRRGEWAALVDEIVPDLVDPATDGPRPGREDQWLFASQWRRFLAMEQRRYPDAEHSIQQEIAYNRRAAALALALPPEGLDGVACNAIRTLAVSLEQLGPIQREQGNSDCVAAYEEAISLCQRIGDRPSEANAAFNLGHAHKDIPALRHLEQAERWYRRSLRLHDERDRLGRGKCMNQLGLVAYERFLEARAALTADSTPSPALPLAGREGWAGVALGHLNTAAQFYHQALDLLPPDAVGDLAVAHAIPGRIYGDAGDLDRALTHYREAIRYDEVGSNVYEAAKHRFNVAIDLANADRLADALEYTRAALRGFASYGDRAADMMQKTQGLIAKIEQAMRGVQGW